MTLAFCVLVTSAVTVMGFGKYPGPDQDTDTDNGLREGVTATSVGTYAWECDDVYQNCQHWGSRWAEWPSEFEGAFYVRFYSNTYDNDYWSSGDSEGGGGTNVWVEYVTSYVWAEFTNGLGGTWEHSATASVTAMPA